MALLGRCSPEKLTTGKQPDLTYLKMFGCEVMTSAEKGKLTNFEQRADRGIYLGPFLFKDTYKIGNLFTSAVIYRRNVVFKQ